MCQDAPVPALQPWPLLETSAINLIDFQVVWVRQVPKQTRCESEYNALQFYTENMLGNIR